MVLVTILGWAALIKGLMLLPFPDLVKVFKPFYESTVFVIIAGLISLFTGLTVCYTPSCV